MNLTDVLIPAIVFYAIYMIIKTFTDFSLKRKIIKSGHLDRAAILETQKSEDEFRFPSLKWALVSFFAGAGLILIECLHSCYEWISFDNPILPLGIELVSISLGFMIYFVIVVSRKK